MINSIIKAGVIGWPVGHSRSPAIHGFWLKQYHIAGSYDLLPVGPGQLGAALADLRQKNYAGCNITLPHKEDALRIVDTTDALAQKAGAVNTVIIHKNGKLEGRNSDVIGFTRNLESAGKAWRKKKPALILGAGGAARAVIVAVAEAGCTDIRIANRSSDRALSLSKEMNAMLGKDVVTPVGWEDREDAAKGAKLIVNTTTGGMKGEAPLDFSLKHADDDALVTDIVYMPLMTPLLLDAKKRGHPYVDGLGMLLHQAAPGFKAWFGREPEVGPELRKAIEATL